MNSISKQALNRMPYYLQTLKEIRDSGAQNVAAPAIAERLQLNEVQVRKDLAAVCTTRGKPKTGFLVQELIENMEDLLGYHNSMDAVLVGVGSLGHALLSFREFENYGLHIVMAFDADPALDGQEICGHMVFDVTKMENLCERMKIHIGIITVPGEAAQGVCDRLVRSGAEAIWNFAPVKLTVPDTVLVQNENLAASLASLSHQLQERFRRENAIPD